MAMSTLERVLADYLEMPGLCVTPKQAARLWNLTPEECKAVLATLVESGQLYCDDRGQYARRAHGLRQPSSIAARRAIDVCWTPGVSRP